jgi:hypothetical protein
MTSWAAIFIWWKKRGGVDCTPLLMINKRSVRHKVKYLWTLLVIGFSKWHSYATVNYKYYYLSFYGRGHMKCFLPTKNKYYHQTRNGTFPTFTFYSFWKVYKKLSQFQSQLNQITSVAEMKYKCGTANWVWYPKKNRTFSFYSGIPPR